MASDYFSGWAIRSPWNGSLRRFVGRTRAEAIMDFLERGVSKPCYDEAVEWAKSGWIFVPDTLSATAREEWPKWRRKGYMAVRVQVETCDHRVSGDLQ